MNFGIRTEMGSAYFKALIAAAPPNQDGEGGG